MPIYNKMTLLVCLLFLVVALINRGTKQKEERVSETLIKEEPNETDEASKVKQVASKSKREKKENSSRKLTSESRRNKEISSLKTFSTERPSYRNWQEMSALYQASDSAYLHLGDSSYFLTKAKILSIDKFKKTMGKMITIKNSYVIYLPNLDTSREEKFPSLGKVLLNKNTMEVALFFNDGFIETKAKEDVERVRQDLESMQIKFEYGGSETTVQIFLTHDMNWKKMESTLKNLPGVKKVYPRFLTDLIHPL